MATMAWTELPEICEEPDAPAVVLDTEGTGWVRAKFPGRPDVWYRVGGGKGPSSLGWEELPGPLFLATGSRDVLSTIEVAYRVAEKMGWAGAAGVADAAELAEVGRG